MDCAQPSRQKTEPLPYNIFVDYFEHQVARHGPWEVCAQDRPLWRSMIHTGARTAETNRIAEAQKKRAAHTARRYSTTSTSAGPTYHMPRVWKSAACPNWTD